MTSTDRSQNRILREFSQPADHVMDKSQPPISYRHACCTFIQYLVVLWFYRSRPNVLLNASSATDHF